METLLIILLLPLPSVAERVADPSHAIWMSKTEARNLDCTRMTQARAHELYPGRVPEPAGRITPGAQFGALACARRYVHYGERPARDELILSSLRQAVGEIAEVASAVGPAPELTWHVDAYYPDAHVAAKISVAAKTELAEKGRRVSDKVPVLAAGDLVVLRDLPPKDAYRIACARYFEQNVLGENDALLGVMLVDPRESQLHAGVCLDGKWRWLR